MKLPKHINIEITHNPHSVYYESAKDYIGEKILYEEWSDNDFISQEDKQVCIDSNDFWTIHWYPKTPVSFCYVVASTLEKALEVANMGEE